jgi:hypothetical protein
MQFKTMTCQNQYKPSCVSNLAVGDERDVNYPDKVVNCLRKSRAKYNPTICLFVENRLRKMYRSSKSKQD